jgi:hypothetical protein
LLAWVASRFFVEARRTGELELLLTTPLGAGTIVSGQWQALKRLLCWPVLVLLVSIVLRTIISLMSNSAFASPWRVYHAVSLLLSLATTVAGLAAVCWVGLWFGLKSPGQTGAILWTVGLTKGLPSIVILFGVGILSVVSFSLFRGSPPFSYIYMVSWLPQGAVLVFYAWLIRAARRRLLSRLAGAETVSFDLRRGVLHSAAVLRQARHWTPGS